MRTALRKMGNSTGMIVPKALLAEIGVAAGASMEVRVEHGSLIASPVRTTVREGWAEDAVLIGGPTEEERDWLAFGNDGDAELSW